MRYRPFIAYRIGALLSVALLFTGTLCSSEDLSGALIEKRSHDFGAVARGAKVQHEFTLNNRFDRPLKVAAVRSSCGCTAAFAKERVIAPGASTEIVAKFNTRSFLGKRSATITVVLTGPIQTEVQLNVTGYIRSDLVFFPGEIHFGKVTAESGKSIKTEISYAGSAQWKIVDILSAQKHLIADLVETERSSTAVTYQLTTTLKPTAPVGFFAGELIIVTNDQKRSRVPLPFSAKVIQPLSISPKSLELGTIATGTKLSKRVVIKAETPFKILDIQCDNNQLQSQFSHRASKLQMISLSLHGSQPSKFNGLIKVQTDLGDGMVTAIPLTYEMTDAVSIAK